MSIASNLSFLESNTGTVSITNTATAFSTLSGALTVTGGAGVGGNLYVGGTIYQGGVAVGTGGSGNVATQSTLTNALFYPIFVSTSTPSATVLSEYTTSSFSINPSTGAVSGGGIRATTSASPPTSPAPVVGDIWYSSNDDIVYRYELDGAGNNYWIDITSPVISNQNPSFGAQGTQGVQGFQGIQGVQGFQGTQAAQGIQGIGGTGTFNGGTITNALYISANTQSTGTLSGSLVVTGGSGIGGNLYVGGIITATNIYIGGFAVNTGTSLASSTGTTSTFTIQNTTNSTSTNSGALQVWGGVGVAGNLFVGGVITATSGLYAASPNAILTVGTNLGLYPLTFTAPNSSGRIAQFLGNSDASIAAGAGLYTTSMGANSTNGYISVLQSQPLVLQTGGTTRAQIDATGVVTVYSTASSTSTTTGALVVAGGVGAAGNIYTGGRIGWVNTATNASGVYQYYNTASNSLDTIFG